VHFRMSLKKQIFDSLRGEVATPIFGFFKLKTTHFVKYYIVYNSAIPILGIESL